jgi:hypothetical protein
MAQEYKGTLLGNNGRSLMGVKVTLKFRDEIVDSTFTDKSGFFLITTDTNIPSDAAVLTFTKDNYVLYTIKNPQPTGVYPPKSKKLNNENLLVVYYEGKIPLNGQNGTPVKINQSLTPQDTIYVPAGDIIELQFQDKSKVVLKTGTYKIEDITKPNSKPEESSFDRIFGGSSPRGTSGAGIRR